MLGTFDFFLLVQHLAHGPISDADLDVATRLFFGGLVGGLLIMLTSKISAAGVWRALILITGGIVTLISLLGLFFSIGSQF